MSGNRQIFTCSAAYGSGGLGQHFTQIVEAARAQGILDRYYSSRIKPDDAIGNEIHEQLSGWFGKYTPARFSPGWKNFFASDLFDRAVARGLSGPIDEITCFGGQSLRSFRKAKTLGATRLHLMAANSHVRNVARLHGKAIARNPIELTWLNEAQIKKTLKEYAEADVIHVASNYTLQTFLDAGFERNKLQLMRLETAARFKPAAAAPMKDGVFRVVYTGSLTVMKGIPLLIEAFTRLHRKNAELVLIGGWATRGMKHYLRQQLAADSRINLAPGDPLPHLQRAHAFVHPSWEDGWAYSAAEAVACGVPVIVTEDTGMKELVRDGVNGYIVPTGDVDAIYDRLEHLSTQ